MAAYVTGKELLDENGEYYGIIPFNDLEELSEKALDNLLIVGKEIIDAYCQRNFEDIETPYIVKIVNIQLIPIMLADASKISENIEGYSYSNNLDAFSSILCRLNILKINEETISGRKKSIRAKVI